MSHITADRCLLCGEPVADPNAVVNPAAYPWELADLAGVAHRDCANKAFTLRESKPKNDPEADPDCPRCKGRGVAWYIDGAGDADRDVCDCVLNNWGRR